MMRYIYTHIALDYYRSNQPRFEVVLRLYVSCQSQLAAHDCPDSHAMIFKMQVLSSYHADDMNIILQKVCRLRDDAKRACDQVFRACLIFSTTGRPAQHKAVSLTHVHSDINQDLQAKFLVVSIQGAKLEVLNFNNTDTRYGEPLISAMRHEENILNMFDTKWMYYHRGSKAFQFGPQTMPSCL